MMYFCDETVNAVLNFYQQVIRHPYLENSALILPSPTGWVSIENVDGKNETVLDLLRHLPYLRAENPYEQLLVNYEATPVVYANSQDRLGEATYPSPAHCLYFTQSADHLDTSLILDTDQGTITEFSRAGSHITVVPLEEYDALPEMEKWKAYRTLPAAEFLGRWTRRFGGLVWMLVPNPVGQPATGRFYSRAGVEAEEEEELVR